MKIKEFFPSFADFDLVYLANLESPNMQEIRYELYSELLSYNAFMVVVLSNHDKIFAFFVPHTFQETKEWTSTFANLNNTVHHRSNE